jgi:predicted GIY-YIG superfamily endonuclease
MKGRTIKVFLADGAPDGLRTAEIMNWTGKMLVFPQSQLADFLGRSEAKRTGIYILVGDDPNNPTKEQVYIGESDDVSERLKQHSKDTNKEFWSRTVVVVSKDENLSKAHVRFLENRLIALAARAKRAVLVNGNSGAPVSLAESDIADMEYFLSQIQVLLPVLGFPFTQALPSPTQSVATGGQVSQPHTSPPLTLAVGNHAARAIESNGTFVVQAGSYLQANAKPAIGNTYRQKRDALFQAGTVVATDQPDYWKFAEDTAFDSPSAAGAVIQGYNVNGRVAWRINSTSQTYKEWQEAQIAAVGAVQPAVPALLAAESGTSTTT